MLWRKRHNHKKTIYNLLHKDWEKLRIERCKNNLDQMEGEKYAISVFAMILLREGVFSSQNDYMAKEGWRVGEGCLKF